MGRARKFAAAHSPTARGRSASLNITVSPETAMTITPAPASPRTSRAAMNAPADPAEAQAADARPNSRSAPAITFLRPKRSPSSPAGIMAAARTRA